MSRKTGSPPLVSDTKRPLLKFKISPIGNARHNSYVSAGAGFSPRAFNRWAADGPNEQPG
jgi:hypothetical protein